MLGDDEGLVACLGVYVPVAGVVRQRQLEQVLGDNKELVACLGVHIPADEGMV